VLAQIVLDFLLTICTLGICCGNLYLIVYSAKAGLLDLEALTNFLATACPAITVVQFVAPAPLVYQAVIKPSGSSLPRLCYWAQAACNILGAAYAIQIGNGIVLGTNMFGLFFQIIYLVADHIIRNGNGRWLSFAVQIAAVLNTSLIISSLGSPVYFLGHGITACNIFLSAAPLGSVKMMLSSKKHSLSIGLTLLGLVSNALWTTFALVMTDLVLLFPSVLGFWLSIFQVLLLLWSNSLLPFDISVFLLLCGDTRETVLNEIVGKIDKQKTETSLAPTDCEMAIAG